MDRPLVLATISSPASKQARSAISSNTVGASPFTAKSLHFDARIPTKNGTEPVDCRRLPDGRGEVHHSLVNFSVADADETRAGVRLRAAKERSAHEAVTGGALLLSWSAFDTANLARRGIQVSKLLPEGGVKDFNEEWVLLHA